jgi:predicted N-acetyltransferase YhbS
MANRTFRTATPADLDLLVEIINRAFVIERPFKAGGDRVDAAEVSGLMNKGTMLLAEEDGAAQGCVYYEFRGSLGYLGLLSVEPALQGKGLGKALMEAAEDRLRQAGCSMAEIRVLSLRTELPPLYRRAGYVEAGTEPVHVESITLPCEFLKMTKALV